MNVNQGDRDCGCGGCNGPHAYINSAHWCHYQSVRNMIDGGEWTNPCHYHQAARVLIKVLIQRQHSMDPYVITYQLQSLLCYLR